MVLGAALTIIGIIAVIFGLLAVLGLSSIVPGDAVANGIQGAIGVFFNWWQLWLPILMIAIVAYVARSGKGGNSTTDTIVGAAEGVTKGLRSDGGNPNSIPNNDSYTHSPPNPSDPTEDNIEREKNNQRTTQGNDNSDHQPTSSEDKRAVRDSSTNDDSNLSRRTHNNDMASNTEIGSLEHELEKVVNEIGEEEQREQDELNELEQAKQELTTALRELQKHEQMEEFIIAINKEGLSNKGSADAKAQVVQKYAQKYLGSSPQLEDIERELQHLTKIEELIEDAERHMSKVDKEQQADVQETQKVEQELAKTFSNLDHLLDASRELQHYY